jgi:hypothetical protein
LILLIFLIVLMDDGPSRRDVAGRRRVIAKA